MNTKTTTADEPNKSRGPRTWWEALGLHADPFMPSAETHDSVYCYMPKSWDQSLDLLNHLSHYSNVLTGVVGETGIGKTAFKDKYIAQLDEETRFIEVSFAEVATVERLIDKISQSFSIDPLTEANESENLDKLICELQQSASTCIFLIDNANELPDEILNALLHLVKQQSEEQMRFHAILFGETILEDRLAALKNDEEEDIVHCIKLNALNDDDVRGYLRHRLLAAGLNGDFPFTEKEVKVITANSQGKPHDINIEAEKLLKQKTKTKTRKKTTGVSLTFVVLSGLLAAVIAYHYSSTHLLAANAHIQGIGPTPAHKNVVIAEPRMPVLHKVHKDAIAMKNQIHQVMQAQQKKIELKPQATLADASEALHALHQMPVHSSLTVTDAKKEAIIPKPKKIQKIKEMPKAKKTHQKISHLTIHHNHVELSPIKKRYTLQFIGARKISSVNTFLKEFKLKDNYMVYHTMKGNKPWYVLVYGQYDTYANAMHAIHHLSPHLAEMKPWIRPSKQIQAELGTGDIIKDGFHQDPASKKLIEAKNQKEKQIAVFTHNLKKQLNEVKAIEKKRHKVLAENHVKKLSAKHDEKDKKVIVIHQPKDKEKEIQYQPPVQWEKHDVWAWQDEPPTLQ